MSICHVVIIVQDWIGNVDEWKFYRTVEMLKYGIPDVSTIEGAASDSDFFPEIGS